MDWFSRIYAFNAYGDKDNREKKIKSFIDAGWEYIGETPIISAPFISVGWPKEKEEIIYPADYSEPK